MEDGTIPSSSTVKTYTLPAPPLAPGAPTATIEQLGSASSKPQTTEAPNFVEAAGATPPFRSASVIVRSAEFPTVPSSLSKTSVTVPPSATPPTSAFGDPRATSTNPLHESGSVAGAEEGSSATARPRRGTAASSRGRTEVMSPWSATTPLRLEPERRDFSHVGGLDAAEVDGT